MPLELGACHSDVKSFLPMIFNMTCLAIWFSELKHPDPTDYILTEKRSSLVKSMMQLSPQIESQLSEDHIKLYKSVALALKRV